nr:PHP domain-containing protein [Anaerolineae bacterium]
MSIPCWRIDLHSHTNYSRDCLTRLEDLQEICRKQNIDKLAITDHNTARGALEAARLYPMLIIPGQEIMTTRGEILAWFVREEVPAGLSPQETISRLRDQNAVIGIAHPFDRYRRGAWQLEHLLEIIDLVDCVEVFNARCLHDEDNNRALEFAGEHQKLKTAGSDAHTRREYGRGVVEVEPFHNSADGLRSALQEAAFTGIRSGLGVHFRSTYAKWIKRVLPGLKSAASD